MEYAVLGGLHIKPPPDFPAPVVPTFSRGMRQSLSPADWPSLWRHSRVFCDEVLWSLKRLGDREGTRDRDVFFLYHAHPAHISSAIRLGLALGGNSPIVLNLYYLHMNYSLHGPSRIPGLSEFLVATGKLRRQANVHLRVDSPRLAESIRRDTGEHVEVLPFFSLLEELPSVRAERPPDEPLRLFFPTANPDASKGFDLVVGLAEKLNRKGVEILAREPGEGALEVCLPTLVARQGGLRLIRSFLPAAGYSNLMAESDIILIPYRQWQFLSRTSCIVADAVLQGKPMVGTAGTWIADQIEALGAGRTFPDGDIDGFVEAVQKVIENLESYRRTLGERSGRWIEKNNPGVFIRALAGCGGSAGSAEGERSFRETLHSSIRRDLRLAHLKSIVHVHLPLISLLHRIGRRLKTYSPGPRGRLRCARAVDLVPGALRKGIDRIPLVRWNCRGVEKVELRLDAPDGFPLASGEARGEVWGIAWLEDGREIFLQDVTGGKPLTSRHTLHCMRYRYGKEISTDRGRLLRTRWAEAARPAVRSFRRAWIAYRVEVILPAMRLFRRIFGGPSGDIRARAHGIPVFDPVRASVEWSTTGTKSAEVRINGLGGRLFARDTEGRVETDRWVRPEMGFFLVDTSRPYLPASLRLLDVAKIPPLEAPPYPVSSFHKLVRRMLPSRRGVSRTGLAWMTGFATMHIPGDAASAAGVAGTSEKPGAKKNLPSIESVLTRDEWGITPSPTSGEIFLLCAYSKAFLERYGGNRIVIFGPASYVDVCNLFPNAPVSGKDIKEFFVEKPRRLRQKGRSIYLDYGRGVNDGLESNYSGRHASFAEIFLDEVGISLEGPRVKPHVSVGLREDAARRFRRLGLTPGRTAILAPIAGSLVPPPLTVWKRIAEVLRQRGFSVATNAGPGECVLPGTVPLFTSFSEMYAMVEMAGLMISARSGLCDVCSTAETRMHILLSDHQFVVFPGVLILQRLADNGLNDEAIYHTIKTGEGSLEFAERVLAHPDLRERTVRGVRPRGRQ